jgi:SAM-dependent methyltransferase
LENAAVHLKCMELCKTICEAFECLKKNGRPLSLLNDVKEALKAISSNIPQILSGAKYAEFQQQTGELKKCCEICSNSAALSQNLFHCFVKWDNARINLLYMKAITAAFEDSENTESYAPLLEFILADTTVPQMHSATAFFLSRIIGRTQPFRAYQMGLSAFEADPSLCSKIFPKETNNYSYIYHPVDEVLSKECPICHGTGTPYYCAAPVKATNYNSTFSPMKLWMRCNSCGQLFAYNFPRKMIEAQPEEEELGDENMKPRLGTISIFGGILKEAQKHTKGRHLLDVGAGLGELIAAALELGYEPEGIEISRRQSKKLEALLQVKIHCMDFLKFESPRTFDIITMGDVIEHITDPTAALKKANSLLTDGGILWISTPNYESGFSRLVQYADPMWNEPYHFTYYAFSGFREILQKAGFQVLEYTISNRYNGSMELIAKKTNPSQSN